MLLFAAWVGAAGLSSSEQKSGALYQPETLLAVAPAGQLSPAQGQCANTTHTVCVQSSYAD